MNTYAYNNIDSDKDLGACRDTDMNADTNIGT